MFYKVVNCLNIISENYKKKKGIALKVSSSIQEGSDKQDSNEIDEDDDFSLFVKRFNKFLRNKGNKRRSNFKSKKKAEDSSSLPKCYECNQPWHLRVDCPSFKKRIERSEKKTFNDKKAKKAYITWEDNDMDSSEDSENEVGTARLCLQVKKRKIVCFTTICFFFSRYYHACKLQYQLHLLFK